MKEKWKPVRNYETHYLVSDTGKVKRIGGKTLSPNPVGSGYLQVRLSKNGIEKAFRIHRLVLEAFVGPIVKGKTANHIDADRRNNCLSNLEICTYSENIRHAYRLGHRSAKGENNTRCKLDNKIVRAIRRMRQKGVPGIEVAKIFQLSPDHVCRIYKRRLWNHI